MCWAGITRREAKGPSLVGDLLVLAALLVSLFWILMNKRLMERHPPAVITVYGVYSGAIMIAVWVLLQDGPPPVHGLPLAAWLASAASGLFCTAGSTLLWNWGIHHVPASRAAVFLNIEPMLGSFLGVELLGDHLGPLAWIGGVLILAAADHAHHPAARHRRLRRNGTAASSFLDLCNLGHSSRQSKSTDRGYYPKRESSWYSWRTKGEYEVLHVLLSLPPPFAESASSSG